MDSDVWVHCLGPEDDAQTFVRALHGAGLRTRPLTGDFDDNPGVLLFERFDESVTERLRLLSRGGRVRVLAACITPLRNDDAWHLLAAGAADALHWDRGCDHLPRRLAARLARWNAVEEILGSPLVRENLVGESTVWKGVLRRAIEVACFTDASILILGESGTGKELLARLIHTLDRRHDKRELVVLDCTTVMPELSGSEFFGHERGAFTGAVAARDGAFALADGGTLFLDEVGELPPTLQSQLLRVIQEGTYKRVGGSHWHRTQFRLICATNRDLVGEVARGWFRGDLYYRLADWAFRFPPLCERPEDIVPLAEHFLAILHPGADRPSIDRMLQEFLIRRSYPGNVRELRQLIGRIYHRHVGPGPLTLGDIPEEDRLECQAREGGSDLDGFEHPVRRALACGLGLKDINHAVRETTIRVALEWAGGNLRRAADKLGITTRALQMRRLNARRSDRDAQSTEHGRN